MDSVYILYLIPIIIVIWIIIVMRDKKKQKQEFKELQNTPIEVYRYTYKVYLNDGSNYIRTSIGWFAFNFEKFIKRCILVDDTLRIDNKIVVNTENISKFEVVKIESEIINPIMERFFNTIEPKEIYFPEEIVKQKLLNKIGGI